MAAGKKTKVKARRQQQARGNKVLVTGGLKSGMGAVHPPLCLMIVVAPPVVI